MSTNLTNHPATSSEPPRNHRIDIRGFSLDTGASYEANPDLYVNLCKSGNFKSGTIDGGIVLVMLAVDDDHNEVEVQCGTSYDRVSEADAIDAAIEALIVVRDSLRKIEAAA